MEGGGMHGYLVCHGLRQPKCQKFEEIPMRCEEKSPTASGALILPRATAPARRINGDYDGKQDSDVAALPGRSSFQLLQVFKSSRAAPLVYYVFDLLFLEGKDPRREPFSARRKLLAKLLEKAPDIQPFTVGRMD
jgi:hypothetical protein